MSNEVGKRYILPSSYTESSRYKIQNYQDAMATYRWAGYPDLFLTFTCNPKWLEIEWFLAQIEKQKIEDRVDIINRVFQIKLQELITYLKKKNYFGRTIASKLYFCMK